MQENSQNMPRDNFSFVLESLQNAKNNNRLAHAYIVYSDDPVIRKNFSQILAQIILCSKDKAPCGICNNCKKVEKGIYPDLFTLEPTSKTRQIVIGKNSDDPDTIRWFQDRFSLSSMSEGHRKIGIIYSADRINVEGQNAFLKTLEEPSKGSHFILSSGNPHALLPTVISRCQIIPLLTNKCSYRFSGSNNLFDLLLTMISSPETSLQFGVDTAEKLLGMFNNLRKEAETKVSKRWEGRLDNMDNLGVAARNQMTLRYEAAVAGEYRLLREHFLDAINSWFAQIFQISSGVNIDFLANPEIVSNYLASNFKLSQAQATKLLNKTEKLISNFYWNVSEDLAIQEYCVDLVVNR